MLIQDIRPAPKVKKAQRPTLRLTASKRFILIK